MRNSAALWVAVIAAALTCSAVYGPTLPLVRHTGGIALYPLDDTYIHLALGRTLAEAGTWGVSPDVPAAASSSPLWTMILAAGRLVIRGDVAYSWLPLVLNVLVALALITVWARVLTSHNRTTTSGLVAVTLGSALPMLALLGLEHVLQCLTTILLAWTAAGTVAGDTERKPLSLACLAGLATATRYESLFLVLPVAVMLLIRNRRAEAFATVGGAVVPVICFGVFWSLQGGTFLPNALMLKGAGGLDSTHGGTPASIVGNIIMNVSGLAVGAPRGLIGLTLLALTAAIVGLRRFGSPRDRCLGDFALWAAAAQLVLGQFGWLYRYEAWLVTLAAVAILRLAGGIVKTTRGSWVVAAILLAALAPRAISAGVSTAKAPSDRLWEHFAPVAVFNDSSLSDRPILANDVGVLAYTHRGRPVDFYGLADNQPIALRLAGDYGPEDVSNFARARGAEVGAIQLCWPDISRRFPSGWSLIEAWQGPRNVVFGDLTVAFIATPQAADALSVALRKAVVPAGVERWMRDDPRVMQFNSADDKRAATAGICRR